MATVGRLWVRVSWEAGKTLSWDGGARHSICQGKASHSRDDLEDSLGGEGKGLGRR